MIFPEHDAVDVFQAIDHFAYSADEMEEFTVYGKGWFKELIYHLFETGDEQAVYSALEELGYSFGVDIPDRQLKLKNPDTNRGHLPKG